MLWVFRRTSKVETSLQTSVNGTVLGGAGDGLKPDSTSSTALWLHWPEDDNDDVAVTSSSNMSEPLSIESIDCAHIALDFLVFKAIVLYAPPSNSITLAADFPEDCTSRYPTANRGFWMGFDKDTEDFQERWLLRSQIIVFSLHCGLHWIVNTMTFSSSLASAMQIQLDDSEGGFDLQRIVARLLRAAYPSELSTLLKLTTEQKRAVLQYFFYVLFVFPLEGEVPILFSPKSPQDASTSGYAVSDMGSAGKAISRNGRINVPKAVVAYTMLAILASSSCATIRRLWILAPMKSDHGVNSVETVKKLRLFTLVPFKDDSARVLRWNNQRIQG